MISKLMKKKNQKGFTLMEMLIVVAIIAILVAIMIPSVTSQLEKARQTTDLANIRSAYAEAMVEVLSGEGDDSAEFTLTKTKANFDKVEDSIPEFLKGDEKTSGWADVVADKAQGTYTITVDEDGGIKYEVKS